MWLFDLVPCAAFETPGSRARMAKRVACTACAIAVSVVLAGCAGSSESGDHPNVVRIEASEQSPANTAPASASAQNSGEAPAASQNSAELPVSDIALSSAASAPSASAASSASSEDNKEQAKKLFKKLGIKQDFRKEFVHGDKPAKYQKYIVLHDTEGDGSAEGVIDYWDGSDAGVAAHFVVNKDGSIVQCVKLDKITHHAGFGDTGHNKKYGVEDESRDDKEGTVEIGSDFADYGMNSYSIGIEMVHVGGSGDYPKKQLEALDGLIAYIDTYYGKESKIIDHKAWRSGNSDTSEEFADYLKNYQDHRSHKKASSKS